MIVTVVDNMTECEGVDVLMCWCVDAHQTPAVVLIFADDLHQQVVFPLCFLHLEERRPFTHIFKFNSYFTGERSAAVSVVASVRRPTWLECLLCRWWLWEDDMAWSLSTCCICCSHILPRAWGDTWRWGNSSTSTGRSSFSFTFTGERQHRILAL